MFEGICYPEGKIAEDSVVSGELLKKSSKIVLNENTVYYYIHRKESITTKQFSYRDFELLEAWKKNERIITDCYPELAEYGKMHLLWACFFVMDQAWMK